MSYTATNEDTVNTFLTGSQSGIAPIVLANGGWIQVWRSSGNPDESGTGIYMQRFNADGEAIGGERHVNTTTTGSQLFQEATALANGGWVIGWTSSSGADPLDDGVYVQRYNANGVAVGGEVLVNTSTEGSQSLNDVTTLADGSWIVSWESENGDSDGQSVMMQRFAANGSRIGGEVQINSTETGDQTEARITALENGGWVANWGVLEPTSGFTSIELMQQIYDANGNKVGSETQVNGTFEGTETHLRDVTLIGSNRFLVTWVARDVDGDTEASQDYGIYQQLYKTNGVAIGDETRVNTTTEGFQANSATAALSDGGWLTVWQSSDGSRSGVFAQRFDATGQRIGGETRINTTTEGSQEGPIVVEALADGGWVIGWSSVDQDAADAVDPDTIGHYGVYLQRFSIDGEAVDGEFQVHQSMTKDQHSLSLTALDNGDFIASWHSQHRDGDTSDIMQRIFRYEADTFTGTDSADTLTGTLLDDIFVGKRGNDIYRINHVDDAVLERSNAGRDTLQASISVNLSDYANVESIELTGTGAINGKGTDIANSLTGNGADNVLTGLGGVDTIKGGNGKDRIDGGRGNDNLEGGGGSDTFIFRTGDDADTITGFSAKGTTHDVIDIRNLGSVANFADLRNNHMEAFGNNVLIDGGEGDTITLLGVRLRDLDSSDFLI
ncbi:calcium-binding protein [Rhizobium alvei]|uniref:Uncharacterized protein n=1 Tax=Rhizobium alvei TaxID=1132659 RepID=A0ABT8YG50_9HYPH|nr:hypothetical protein [Rhizobium alvei]MDO6962437.1 hypothetical protein [Rhizobium alvei]